MFRKRNDNIVTLEFQNNQIGKPKVRFDGVCEADYNDKDAILFFDGETFRLEKLHRAVKRLKYMRVPEATTMVNETEIDINNPISLDHENEEDPNRMGQESARKETTSTKEFRNGGLDIDINLPHPAEMEDDEIAVVDINDDESYKGLNAAEVLRAQVNAEAREEDRKSSTSSSESGAESSGSGSSSTSCNSRNSGSESGTGSH